jgi:hypothetical protein
MSEDVTDMLGLGAAVERIAELARKGVTPTILPGPNGEQTLVSMTGTPVVTLIPKPPPAAGAAVRLVCLTELAEFCRYVELMSNPAIFVQAKPVGSYKEVAIVIAIPDYDAESFHREEAPRACLTVVQSPDWQLWTKVDRQWMSQDDFVFLIEDQIDRILQPPASRLMEMLRDVSATENKAVRKVLALDGSTRLVHAEVAKIEGNDVALPQYLTINLRACSETEPAAVRARLSVKVNDGQVSFRVALQGLDVLLDDAIEVISSALVEKHPERTFRGYVDGPAAQITG